MKVTAKDVMTPDFHTLRPGMRISEAIQAFQQATREEGRKIFGMLVTGDDDRLLGMLSMYDILLLLKPKHIQIWGKMEDIQIAGLLETTCRQARDIRVGDIMTTELITVAPDTHLLVLLDIMISKHIRRIPVISNSRILGMVYISDLFYHLVETLK